MDLVASDNFSLNMEVLRSANEGDMIEFPRELYSHWGIYVGSNKVIHLAGEPGDETKNVTVRRDHFWTVAGTSIARVNNIWDDEERALPGSEIVERAESKLGHEGYSLLFMNCEHFASWCRYDKARSSQTEAINQAVNDLGSHLRKELLDVAENNPDEATRSTASGLLQFGQLVMTMKDTFIKINKDHELKGLKPGK